MSKRFSAQELKAMVDNEMRQAEENRSRTGTGNPFPPSEPGEFTGMAVIRLKVADVDPYEDNPRQTPNEKFLEIKESIRARGLDQSLVVTKRPGASRYILAKGGKTRLRALKELAQEDPKFEAIDFQHVHYQSESELLVAHMVENVQHNQMNFWDTANGFLLLRTQRSKELQRSLSNAEFALELKKLGFEVDRLALGEFEFLYQVLRPLQHFASEIGSSDVRNFLRPQYSTLQEIFNRIQSEEKTAFEQTYRSWLEAFVGQQPQKQVQVQEQEDGFSTVTFDPTGLTKHIDRSAAEFLGLSEAELSAAQAALSKDRKIDVSGLRAAIAAATDQPQADTSSDYSGGDAQNITDPSTPPDASGTGLHTEDDGSGSAATYRPPQPAGSNGSGRVPDGLSGVTPVPKNLVHTLVPVDANGKPINGESGDSAELDSRNAQGTLPGTTGLEQAADAFRDAVEALTHFAGIHDLLRPALATPMTFFMDAPERPLGTDASDYAVQAWWFLANLSGQITPHVFNMTVMQDGQSVYALPDTGPNGWRQVAFDGARLEQFVQSHLGGVSLVDGFHILNMMIDPNSSMSELALEVVRTASIWNLHKGQ